MLLSLASRGDFPPLAEAAYLDTASDGLVPFPVQRETEEFWRTSTPGRAGSGERRSVAYERPRAAAARLLGAAQETIAITHSASEALAQVAWSLRPQAGTNVVSIDLDFPTVTYPWLRIARETGAEVRLVQALKDPSALSIESLASLVDERTTVISVSHVQYATGHRLDLGALAALAHAHDAILVVDAAQSLGVVPVDVRIADVDVLVGHAGKWLGAENGAGICYLRPELAEALEPPIVGWRSTEEPYAIDATRIRLAPGARRLEFSSTSYISRFALGAAVDYLLEQDASSVLAHSLALGSLLMDGLEALGVRLLSPREDRLRAGIVAARVPERDSRRIVERLAEADVKVSARLGAVRFSLHYYNDESDVRRALEALERVLSSPDRD
jgi:cysteine desulfurase / selenocysteine lyase